MAMAVTTTAKGSGGAISPAYVAKAPPPPPGFHKAAAGGYGSYNGSSNQEEAAGRAVEGVVVALRAAAAVAALVGVALVGSCRHGDWMEFTRYQEYRYLLGASLLACLYAAAQAIRSFRRISSGGVGAGRGLLLLDLAGDQAVAYLLITAASAALPITIRMRSAVINIFTDAMMVAIGLTFAAFAALALSATISVFRLSAASAQPYYY